MTGAVPKQRAVSIRGAASVRGNTVVTDSLPSLFRVVFMSGNGTGLYHHLAINLIEG